MVNNASFIIIFPLTFIANTFVPTGQLPAGAEGVRRLEPGVVGDPGGAGAVRQHQPGAAAARRLVVAAPGGLLADLGRAILPVFVPLSVRKYLRTASR